MRVEEGDELLVPMAAERAHVELADGYVECGKQAGGAVPWLNMGAARGLLLTMRIDPL